MNVVSCCLYLDFLPLATFIIFSAVTALCSCLFVPQVVCTTSVRLWRRTRATVRGECSKRRSLKSSPASDETPWSCSPNCMHLLLIIWHPTFVLLKKKLFWVCLCVFFGCSDVSVQYVDVDEDEAHSIVEEALELRRQRQAKLTRHPVADLQLVQPIKYFTWVQATVNPQPAAGIHLTGCLKENHGLIE